MDASTVFVIAITTAKMIMPGMPAMDNMPGGMNIPGMNDPIRTLTMDLTSDKKANAESKAECEVPGGLKIGPKAILDIDLPQKGETDENTPEGKEEAGKMPDSKMKSYWGCAEVVPDGQPKVFDSKQMTADMQRAMAEKGSMMSKQFAHATYTDNGSHAY